MKDSNLVIVGGSGRNVGKTEFACRLIGQIAAETEVYGLKVSAVYPDEAAFHGDHGPEVPGTVLFEESRRNTGKDTSRMLRAGAAGVFYLCSEEGDIGAAYLDFRRQIPPGAAVICESNSLARYIRPALQIIITGAAGPVKKRVVPLLRLADLVIVSDGTSGFAEIERIRFSSEGFLLQEL